MRGKKRKYTFFDGNSKRKTMFAFVFWQHLNCGTLKIFSDENFDMRWEDLYTLYFSSFRF